MSKSTDADGIFPSPVLSLSPTAKVVYLALKDADAPLSSAAIEDRTGTPASSVRNGLGELKDRGMVVGTRNPPDLRTIRYEIVDGDVSEAGGAVEE